MNISGNLSALKTMRQTYFLDNFTTNKEPTIDENKDETLNQDKDDIAIINQYNENLVKKMFRKIKFKNDMFEYTDLQVSTRHLSAKKWNAHCCLVCICLCLELVLW
jgi:uncharacterized membrane protein (UPF0182 family)